MARAQMKENVVASEMGNEDVEKNLKGRIKYSLNHPAHPIHGVIYHNKFDDVIPITEEELNAIILLAREKRTVREFLIALKGLYPNPKYSATIDKWMP